MTNWFSEEFLRAEGAIVDGSPILDDVVTKAAINAAVQCTRNRPHPWSTASDYTSWKSLTDRTYQARHLPVAPPPARPLPTPDAITQLFKRPAGEQKLSAKSTCLFPAFAQYLTDGFIRTDPQDKARTTSNHEIDLCPLYGLIETQTNCLRLMQDTQGRRGRMKTQTVRGEDFPPFLFENGGTQIKAEFAALDPPLFGPLGPPPAERCASLFAVGGDRVNSTPFSAMMNTLLLREHNRIAGELERRNPVEVDPSWNDERVFQTARNIMIPIFIKIVVEQYINHINPSPIKLIGDPSVVWTANWNRPNWITAEFSLLYRWHSLMPDVIQWTDAEIALADFTLDNRPLLRTGLNDAFLAAARQPAAELGALNTGAALLPIEILAVLQARYNRIDTYNSYRVQFGAEPAQRFSDITSDPEIEVILKSLYQTPDDVEFYPGLFAEDRIENSPLPGLLFRMVAVDAFSQALTNPLLSQHVFNEQTFTPWGFELIQNTQSLGDILARLDETVDGAALVMTQPTFHY